ncbi:MAG TPA: NAD-dependent epimerase/dehydratase family protein, partial [Candidatus Thalassarchaeaceae archaeon]
MGKVMVLGTGLVGGWVADRLATDGHDVIGVDTSISALKERDSKVTCIHGPARIELFEEYVPDVIVNALPGRIGDLIRTDLIRQGLAVADLAFTAEDPREHHE